MARTSKSPRAVTLAALSVGRRSLSEYAHRYSPKKFTQHQLFACLVLKNVLRTDYRGLAAHLEDSPSLLTALDLKQVPHFTTFQKAAHRLLQTKPAQRRLEATVRLHLGRQRRVKRAAIDSTGLECSAASGYFVRRRSRVESPWKTVVYHHYPKLGLVSGIDDHFIYAYQAGRGPRPDVDEFRPLVADALRRVRFSQMSSNAVGGDICQFHRGIRSNRRGGGRSVMWPCKACCGRSDVEYVATLPLLSACRSIGRHAMNVEPQCAQHRRVSHLRHASNS